MNPPRSALLPRPPFARATLLVFGCALPACLPPELNEDAFAPQADAAATDVTKDDGGGGGGDNGLIPDLAVLNDLNLPDLAETLDPLCALIQCPGSGDPCRPNTCVAGQCKLGEAQDGTPCDDKSACTEGDVCGKGVCKPGPVKKCDDGNECTLDQCDPLKGCVHPNASKDCNTDGDDCTKESCADGKCVYKAIAPACDCTADSDCNDPKFGLDLCKGTLYCDKKVPGKNTCEINPKDAVKCPPVPADMTECNVSKCDPATGKCSIEPKKDGIPCKDDLACTLSTVCTKGQCKPTEKSNSCDCYEGTDAECIAWKKAKIDKDATGPYNKCTGDAYCDLATRMCFLNPNTVIKCNTSQDSVCVSTKCEEATGKCIKVFAPKIGEKKDQDPLCNDGDECTKNDKCIAGVCTPGKPNICPCSKDADCASKEDGDACNGTMFCNLSPDGGGAPQCEINPATIVKCPTADDTFCARNVCDPKTGKCLMLPVEKLKKKDTNCDPTVGVAAQAKCQLVPLGPTDPKPGVVPCDDGNVCTGSSSCQNGQCVTEPTAYVCTCTKDADCAGTGNLCDGKSYCDLTAVDEQGKLAPKCKINPATVVVCNSKLDTQCAKNVCNPKIGKCELTPIFGEGVQCDDGNPCTKSDTCEAGKCVPGTFTCPCTKDADCIDKDDGDKCNGTLYCDKTKPTPSCEVNPATVVTCSKTFDTFCLQNVCDKITAKCEMKPVKEFGLCDDGNPCTVSEVCTSGACLAETNICSCQKNDDCSDKEDGDVCNGTLFCDKSQAPFKCVTNPATVPLPCSASQDTACVHNTCDPANGKCKMVPTPGTLIKCDDGNPCTSGDTCEGDKCVSGTDLCQCTNDADCAKYDDANECNGKLYCDKTGANFKCAPNPKTVVQCVQDPGPTCNFNKCDPTQGSCAKVVLPELCNDGNPCTADACSGGGVCTHNNLADGNSCGVGVVCKQGKCSPP